ncbi:uncharacterized protein LOC135848719 [Planococcus citri]|uniref:uncharacterized protein LOC135848719 n=1 Tax=Planococcus citri TaxID=170843 RepID=UPI0031F8C668
MDSLIADLFVFALQFIQGSWALWFNYVFMTFLFISVAEFTRQYQRLIFVVESLEVRSSQQVVEGGRFDEILKQNIIHCIRHHQILLKNFRLFEIWFSMVFSIDLAVSVVAITFALYFAINVSSLSQLLNGFLAVCFISTNFLIRCLISEIFPNLSERLAESLFWHGPWHKANQRNRIILKMFHSTACQPLRLYGLSVFEAGRVTFGKLMRATYSFFNVMNRKSMR